MKKWQPVSIKASSWVTQMSNLIDWLIIATSAWRCMSQLYVTATNWLYLGIFIYIRNITFWKFNTYPCFSPKQCNITFYHDINKYLLPHKLLYNSYEGRLVLVPKQRTQTESKKSSNILSSITSWWLVAPWFISDLIIALQLCVRLCAGATQSLVPSVIPNIINCHMRGCSHAVI